MSEGGPIEPDYIMCIRSDDDENRTHCGRKTKEDDPYFPSLKWCRHLWNQGFAIPPCAKCVEKAMKLEKEGRKQ